MMGLSLVPSARLTTGISVTTRVSNGLAFVQCWGSNSLASASIVWLAFSQGEIRWRRWLGQPLALTRFPGGLLYASY
ncbi:hypothetical protein PC116_g5440 [Phytophthora cactorum]|uniref:Uncharacterized protein n=1 Tax=Phytophthora cactorum TaxID=29920 RepID=A0A8T1ECM7_9STRA|nr:hypothetical protein Pcac1_g7714 [Phytophthora cactorum]KAG2928449.1 hypothetical protein PC114_g3140 [Phytophthora cactorum]KAG2952327.1 hypothetical protein PC117_g2912 [Phytophthora cactorum]KAG3030867.1 hypothetical protein PC120_g3455 [Phytophthora cactorum]KAG3039086.1 hypothetical protein PC119_g2399 [Phytophthora cactorum]